MGITIDKYADEDYITYQINHDDKSTGTADLRIIPFESGHFLERTLELENIKHGSLIAESFLYPYSRTSLQRCGVGSKVLDFILEDAKSMNVRAVYVQPSNLKAMDFFEKKGFKQGQHAHWYIVLD